MARAAAIMLGIMIGTHGLAGLFIEGTHLLGVLNVDLFIDIVYLLLAGALLVVALPPMSPKLISLTLAMFGVVFLVLGVWASVDDKLGGLMPRGSTLLDLVLFYGAGVGALFVALPAFSRPLQTQEQDIF